MNKTILEKYNIPVPRYTSYPPANFFDAMIEVDLREMLTISDQEGNPNISFYIHIPFCHHLCHYCGCNSIAMPREDLVEEYVDALHKEIDMVKSYLSKNRKIAQIHYGGGSPTSIPLHHLRALNEHLCEGHGFIESPEIAIECHPGYLLENDWEELCNIGFTRMSIGVQDFKEEVLKGVNRHTSLLPMRDVFSILREHHIGINMDFIYGLPFQTVNSFQQTIEKACELRPDRLVTFSYAHVPWVNKRQSILEKKGLPTPAEKGEMFQVAEKILYENGYKSVGMDHFVLPEDELYQALSVGALHRNFQGYCSRRTTAQVYAFGMSAITQLEHGYAQNNKDMATYVTDVRKGILPVTKGYALNKQERYLREVIEQLMCNNCINWQVSAERLHTTVEELWKTIEYDNSKMMELQTDGLIDVQGNVLNFIADERSFVRVVAAAIDTKYKKQQMKYSKPI